MLVICEEYNLDVAMKEHSQLLPNCCCVTCMDAWSSCCGDSQWLEIVEFIYSTIEVGTFLTMHPYTILILVILWDLLLINWLVYTTVLLTLVFMCVVVGFFHLYQSSARRRENGSCHDSCLGYHSMWHVFRADVKLR